MARHEVQALWALAAGELAAGDRAHVEAHVAGCASCAAALEQVKQSRAVLHESREATPDVRWGVVDAGLRAEAARRLAPAATRSRLPWARRRAWVSEWKETAAPGFRLPWAVALAGVCAAMLGFWMLRTPEVTQGGTAVPVAALPATRTETAGGAPDTAQPGLGREGDHGLNTAQAESTSGAVVREVGGAERALQTGAKLRSGVAVRTPARSTALLRLPDASRVRLSEGSDVELSRAEAHDVHLTVRQGRLSVQASHVARQGFLVEAAGLRVSVVGTVFTVERTEHGAAVAVAEGQVRVEVEGQPTRLVGAGERVELDSRERTLKHEPVSTLDQRAFEELSAPARVQGDAVAAVAPTMDPVTEAPSAPPVAAVAPATKVPSEKRSPVAAPSASREERDQVASATPEAPSKGQPKSGEEGSQVASATPRKSGRWKERVESAPSPVEPPAPATAVAEAAPAPAPVAVAAAPRVTDPNQEFAPYPAQSVTESLPPKTAEAPAPPPMAVAERPAQAKKKKEPLLPMALMSKDADERFLGYARMQLTPRTCANFLVGLDEIAQRSPNQAHRAQANQLRSRCFEQKAPPRTQPEDLRQRPKNRDVRAPNGVRIP